MTTARRVTTATDLLYLDKSNAQGHWRWRGASNIRTTDVQVEAERSASYRSTCTDRQCVNPDHQRH